jgi:hypothetical protein
MDVGLAKAWVEELRTRFANKRVRVACRGFATFNGELKEIFYVDKEVHVTVIKDGAQVTHYRVGLAHVTHYRVRLTNDWNDNEISWSDPKTSNGFVCSTTDGSVRFELEDAKASVSSVEGIRKNLKLNKGLAPGLQLVELRGRKGVAPSLLKK